MRRFQLIAGALLLLAVLMASGCYTVLRHPTGSDIVSSESYGKSCSDCHADAQFYHPYYRYGTSYHRWNDYYGYPWWYDDYWWWGQNDDHHHDDGNPPSNVETGERHLWSSGGWASGGWGFTKPSGTSTPSTPSRPKEEQADDSKQSGSDDSKDSKKSDEKPSLWQKDKKKGF